MITVPVRTIEGIVFEDGVDGLSSFIATGTVSTIQPMATNGETVWKAYGYRYFTAITMLTICTKV